MRVIDRSFTMWQADSSSAESYKTTTKSAIGKIASVQISHFALLASELRSMLVM